MLEFIEKWICFPDKTDGLCCMLIKACPKEPEQVPFKEFEVRRGEIKLTKKIGEGQFGEVWAGN